MTSQSNLFPEAVAPSSSAMPDGFRYEPDLISAQEEALLVAEIAAMKLAPYEFRGFLANRNVTAFGFRYSYKTRRMERAPDFPRSCSIFGPGSQRSPSARQLIFSRCSSLSTSQAPRLPGTATGFNTAR